MGNVLKTISLLKNVIKRLTDFFIEKHRQCAKMIVLWKGMGNVLILFFIERHRQCAKMVVLWKDVVNVLRWLYYGKTWLMC
jgi:hypothetical protein